MPRFGACLLGSINLTMFVDNPFTEDAQFAWDRFRRAVRLFTRMLDNVVEINGLPLPEQRQEIEDKRRHGMGYLGLGSAMSMMRIRYGAPESVAFTEEVTKVLAIEGYKAGLELAREKGPAPFLAREFEVTPEMMRKRPEMAADGIKVGDKVAGMWLWARYSRYLQRIAEEDAELIAALAVEGCRFTHHSSLAPTGTIALSLGNNASNGIEPSFDHEYFRNIIVPGRKTKERVAVRSFEFLAYKALVDADADVAHLPEYFTSANAVTPREHVDVQAAAQKWVDSSISKTINVATDMPFEEFKSIYLYAHEKGLKGCTTFRFNPSAFQGVLVKEADLSSTVYRFETDAGQVVELRGDEEVEYDGDVHTAANLYDALKEGQYGRY